MGRAHSLREICGGLACCEGKLKHLGIPLAPKRSTLAYPNEHRPWELYQTVFTQLLGKCQDLAAGLGGRKKFRFKNILMSLDGSVIDLSVWLCDWAKFRRTKGAIKLHLLLDHDGYWPSFAVLTEGKASELKVARSLHFQPGTLLAIDRGYIDYDWFAKLTRQEVHFLTRMKENAVYQVKMEYAVPQNRNVVSDQVIYFPSQAKGDQEPCLFRRVELFFKALKQNLKVKSFVGASENALRIQIWTALIAILLLKWLHHLSKAKWSLSNLASMLRLNLFTCRDLRKWLDDPFRTPPITPGPEQLTLGIG